MENKRHVVGAFVVPTGLSKSDIDTIGVAIRARLNEGASPSELADEFGAEFVEFDRTTFTKEPRTVAVATLMRLAAHGLDENVRLRAAERLLDDVE